jgi:hypothetical protein
MKQCHVISQKSADLINIAAEAKIKVKKWLLKQTEMNETFKQEAHFLIHIFSLIVVFLCLLNMTTSSLVPVFQTTPCHISEVPVFQIT